MRVLHVNKFFWLCGGVERYMFDVSELFERHGHTVAHFAMQDARNRESPFAQYFVSNIQYNDTSFAYKLRNTPRILAKTIYSVESRTKFRRILQDFRPDVVHLHLIDHQISPSILHELRDANVPAVQTLHEYKLICPSYHLYIHHKHEICERCVGGHFYHAPLQRCLKGSFAASALVGFASYVHHALGLHERYVHRFMAPSAFTARKMKQGGLPPEKLRVLRHYLDIDSFAPEYTPGRYALYFGRLSPEKGVETLLRAAEAVPGTAVRIAGSGPGEEELRASATGLEHVHFEGFVTGSGLHTLIREAACVVVPSECYETGPLAVYEAFALGKPVIGARIGGIPELVEEGVTGMLFEPGDHAGLAHALSRALSDPGRLEAMGRAAREKVEGIVGPHYENLLAIYEEAKSAAHADRDR